MAARIVPDWQLKLLRRFPRIGFIGPVELFCGEETIHAKSRNISIGGMLVEADCYIPPQTQVYISFQLPTGWPVKSVGRVVHCRAGKYLGIEFTHMGNADWNELGKSIEIKQDYSRRSIRIPERLFVDLHWHHEGVAVHQPAQTILLSRHGCLLVSQSAPPPDTAVVIWCPERRIGAAARVVWSDQDAEGVFTMALEFGRDANFWGIDFEPRDWQKYRHVSHHHAAAGSAAHI